MVERTSPILDLSHFPPFVLVEAEGEASTIGPALTGAVILRAIEERGIERIPMPPFEGTWTEFMPRPLLASITARERIAVLEKSQGMLKECDLGSYSKYRQEVADQLHLLHLQEESRLRAA